MPECPAITGGRFLQGRAYLVNAASMDVGHNGSIGGYPCFKFTPGSQQLGAGFQHAQLKELTKRDTRCFAFAGKVGNND